MSIGRKDNQVDKGKRINKAKLVTELIKRAIKLKEDRSAQKNKQLDMVIEAIEIYMGEPEYYKDEIKVLNEKAFRMMKQKGIELYLYDGYGKAVKRWDQRKSVYLKWLK